MAISRSSFYAPPADKPDNTKIVVDMKPIADEFEAYGYRRMVPSCASAAGSSIPSTPRRSSASARQNLQIWRDRDQPAQERVRKLFAGVRRDEIRNGRLGKWRPPVTAIDNQEHPVIGEQAEGNQDRHAAGQVAQRGYAMEHHGIDDIEKDLGRYRPGHLTESASGRP